jgi:ParB family chromosome partitioning protein
MPTKTTAKVSRGSDTRRAANFEPAVNPDALFASDEAIKNAVVVDIARVQPSPDQPRRQFDEDEMEALAGSMKEFHGQGRGLMGTGVLLPILVHYPPGVSDAKGNVSPDTPLIITAGERRWRAAERAGLSRVPVVISDKSKDQAYEEALTENILRHDLTPLEEAQAFQYLINKHKLSYRGLAKKLYGNAKFVYLVQKRLDLLDIDDELKAVIDNRPDVIEAARRIKTVTDTRKRKHLIKKLGEGATAREIAEDVRAINSTGSQKTKIGFDGTTGDETTGDETTDDGTNGNSKTGAGKIGRAGSAKAILPKFDLAAAIESARDRSRSVARELQGGASISDATRRKLKQRIKEARTALDELEALLKSGPSNSA